MASLVRRPRSGSSGNRTSAAALRTPLGAARGDRVRTMNSSRRHSRSGLKLFFAAAIVWTSSNATAADGYVPFEGEKTTWHEGFDRYDFIMDDATGAITPIKAPTSEVTSFGIDESIK